MTTLKFIFYLSLLAISTLCVDEATASDYTFEQFEKQFGRTYQGQQRQIHRKAFNKNYEQLLSMQKNSGGDFQVKVNNFTDMTDEEKEKLFSYRPSQNKVPFDSLPKLNKVRAIAVPQQLNYSAMGKVTPIKSQGKCGACWAFTATGMYESQLLIQNVGLFDLSEQYVLQCTQGGSCDGGWPLDALNMIAEKGVPSENLYSYKGSGSSFNKDTICSTEEGNLVKLPLQIETIKHYNSVPDFQLKQILLDHGPVSVGVRGMDTGFLYYAGGVFSGCDKSTEQNQIDHVVMLIGWTKEGNWIIKNSWGKSWGDKGFGIIDGKRNCGITHFVDVLDVKQPVIKNSNGDIAATPNQMDDLKITLTDSYGDGWNGYVFGIRQKNSIVTVFGNEFTNGAKQGPIEIEVKSGIEAEIVVSVVGYNPQQIGFKITDDSGKQLCSRQPGSKFADDIVFCTICPSCQQSNTVSYQLTLTDAGNNGWNDNVLAFKQDGVLTPFGEQFISGDRYGPRKVDFTRNVPVQIVAYKIGHRIQDIAFEIRDSFGNMVFKKQAGDQFLPNQNLGQFCPGCKNLFPVNRHNVGDSRQTLTTLNRTQTTYNILPFIIVVAVLSAIILALVGAILYKYLKNKNSGLDISFSRKGYQAGSIMGSTATIADESPAVAKSPDANKIFQTTQQIKLN